MVAVDVGFHHILKDVVHLVKSALLRCCLAVSFHNAMLWELIQSVSSHRRKPKMAMRNMMNTITLITIRNTPQTISLMMYQRILTIQRKQRNRNANTASPMDCAVCLMFIAAVILGVVCQVLQFCQFFRTISYGVPSCP